MSRTRAWTWAATGAIPILIGLLATVRGAWVSDDAFISFRYVDQLARGLGLVYNPGERVEGYTHFLWVVLLAVLHRAGLDLVEIGRYLPVLFFCGTLLLLFAWSWRRTGSARAFLPLAAWGAALHCDMQIWGSGGLETAAFTLCVTASVLAASANVPRPGWVATLAALATGFRPEGLLVSACVAGYLAWRWRSVRVLGNFLVVWLALVAPLFAWRRIYYHDWLPNTYYAKSGGFAYWEQGWRYISLYFTVYPLLIVGLAAAIVGGIRAFRRRSDDPLLLCGLVSAAMLLYVLRLGGDFMFARFLIPVTPLLFVALEETIRRGRRAVQILGAAMIVTAAVLARAQHDRIFANNANVKGVVDEHRIYPRAFVDERRRQGREMAAILHGLDVRVCTLGSQASFAYFAEFPYVLEKYGLTDRALAHRQIQKRGRPGHEKAATDDDLVARRVHFYFRGASKDQEREFSEVVLGDMVASIVVYDRAVMDSLRGRPGVQFVDYPTLLDSIVAMADEFTPDEKQRKWEFFERYYFAQNRDPERYARARAALDHRARATIEAR